MATKASGLASRLSPTVRQGVGDLVRSMNCYYSNLIEGHDTHPRDIDRALTQADYSTDPKKRALQHEAVAHIEIQQLIDHQRDLPVETTSPEYLIWLHRQFCERLPDEFSWIHPFYDGNGRITRLMSHASLLRCGIGSSLWSVARGLARNVQDYKALLMAADAPRRGDLDGRGTLSTQTLTGFCQFFLNICIDQIDFMAVLLEPNDLLRRMRLHIADEVEAGHLPKGSFPLLREALLAGEVPRGRAGEITGYGERMARNVVSNLLKKGYLKSESPRSPLALAFPIDAVERWFPRLYPTA